MKTCVCGNIIKLNRSKTCKSCSGKRNATKHGLYLIKHTCNSCKVEIKNVYASLCHKCALKKRWEDNYDEMCSSIKGRHHSKETIQKIGNSNLGLKRDDACKKKMSEIKLQLFSDKSKHPQWQGGKSFEEYGKEFDNHLKEKIRFRDKYSCRLCGCSQLENYRQLDVHHKDYDKQNNNTSNLISLCVSCHRKTNWNREKWKEIFNGILVS